MSDDGGVEDLERWMVARLAEKLQVPVAEIDVTTPVLHFGLDSIVAFSLTGELADRLGCDLPATLFWDYPTLESLARHLSARVAFGGGTS
jgi:acyl carrier protein